MRVAYYSPLPPERSGIADYSALLLPALEQLVEIEVVRRGRTRPAAADVALYHVGNDPEAHGWIVEALRRRPGIVVLHDFVLHHLVAGLTIGRKDGPGYLEAMERDAGIPGRLLAHGVLDGRVPPLWETRPDDFPLTGEILTSATGVIVHSRHVEERVRAVGYRGPIWRIPHPAWPAPATEPVEVGGRPLFGCFGHLNPSKRIPELVEAFELVRARHPDARLLLVGPASPGFEVEPLLGPGVIREDYVEEARLWALMAACDACISLRAPTMGETSGSAIRALSLGRPLVVSDLGWFAELPDEMALKVPVDGNEVPALAASLELLAESEATARTMGDAARVYAAQELGLDRVAERYAAALEEGAGGRLVAESVLREIAQAGADVGIEPGTPFAGELAGRLDELGLTANGRPHAQAQRRSRLSRVPAWVWLSAFVVLSTIIRFDLSRRVVAPWIMVDELIYSELAKSFAATGHFLIRDVHGGSYGIIYPALIAPAYRLFGAVPDAYAAAKAIGSVVMSLAALPAYFLARRALPRAASLVAAALALAIPSLAYTGTLMTETVFYPLFLCVALTLVLALERPTTTRQVVLLGTCLLAFLTRSQAIVLIPAIATAPLLLAHYDGLRLRHAFKSFRALYGILAAAVVAVLAVQLARGRSPFDVLGTYGATRHSTYHAGDVLHWLGYHVAELDLYLGVIPFATVLLLAMTGRRIDRPARILVATTVSLTAWLVLEVATFASAHSFRVEERNMFYVAPLFLVALLVWLDRGLPRPPSRTAVAALVAAALPGVLPYERLIDAPAESDTLALLPLWWLQEHAIALGQVALVVGLAAIVVAVLFATLPRRFAIVLPVLVAAWLLFTTERTVFFNHGFPKASVGALFQGIRTGQRDWVDKRVGRGADVAFVYSGADPGEQPLTLWENEFFNRSIGPVYDLRGKSVGGLPEQRLTRRADGILLAAHREVRHGYVLTESDVPLAGTPVARDEERGIVLLRQHGPLRIAFQTTGLYPRDTWSGPEVTYTRYQCAGGRLTVELSSDANLFAGRQVVSAYVNGRRAAHVRFSPATESVIRVPLRPQGDSCRARFVVRPTSIPAVRTPGSSDTRVLGAHFLSFRYSP